MFHSYKNDITDQIEILDNKIKQNEVQYDLYIKAAKISALSSRDLNKHEYLTGEDLDYKPSTVEQAKFDYSPLSKFFNNGLKKEDKKRRAFEDTTKYWRQKQRTVKSN